MRISLLAMSLSVALPSLLFSSAMAAPADPMKSLSSAGNWNEAIKQVEARFPKLIADELRVATKDLAYPTIRTFKGELVITDSSGARITLAFKKDGVALLNGKPLMIKPLATADSEVKRIGSAEDKKVSLADYLLPDAFAGAGIGAGLAAIAFIGADNWKADACAEDELTTKELTDTCPIMGVGMILKTATTTSFPSDKMKKPFKSIGVKCPAENSGILEHLRKSEEGFVAKIRFKVVDGRFVKAITEVAEPGKGFVVEEALDLETLKNLSLRKKLIDQVTPIMENYCNNPENRKRLSAIMESNRKQLARIENGELAPEPSSAMSAD